MSNTVHVALQNNYQKLNYKIAVAPNEHMHSWFGEVVNWQPVATQNVPSQYYTRQLYLSESWCPNNEHMLIIWAP